jgi:hypothetical protein
MPYRLDDPVGRVAAVSLSLRDAPEVAVPVRRAPLT